MLYDLELRIGLTSSDGKIRYPRSRIEKLYEHSEANQLGFTVIAGWGHDQKRRKREDTAILSTTWTINDTAELETYCRRLNTFVGAVFAELQQEWIQVVYATETNPLGSVSLHRDDHPSLDPQDFHIWELIGITNSFGFDKLLHRAQRTIFLVGQNLFYIVSAAQKDKYKQILFGFLRGGTDRRVKILICNPRAREAVKTWRAVVGGQYDEHLRIAAQEFRRWEREAQKLKLTEFSVHYTTLCPATLTFIDPEDDDRGVLVLIPVLHGESDFRPCVLLRATDRSHRYAFQYYYRRCMAMLSATSVNKL